MAKRTKTNKTDHVLNLLASGGKKNRPGADSSAPPVELKKKESVPAEMQSEPEESEALEEKAEKVAETTAKADPETDEPAESREVPEVSVVHLSGEENPLAESVKKSLEAELEAYLEENSEDKEVREELPDLQEDAEQPEEEPETEEFAEPAEKPETAEEPVLEEPEEKSETEPQQEAETQSDLDLEPEPKPESEAESVQPEPASVKPEAAAEAEPAESRQEPVDSQEQPQEEEASFVAVNVMEQLVRNQAKGFIQQFGHCDCPRCVEDTTALALTHLPAKYVVVTRESVSPLLNFYEKKYAGQIIVEITKASMIVAEKPHH